MHVIMHGNSFKQSWQAVGTTAPNRYNVSAAQLQNCLAVNIRVTAGGSSGTYLQIHHLFFRVDESNANVEALDAVGSAIDAGEVVGVPSSSRIFCSCHFFGCSTFGVPCDVSCMDIIIGTAFASQTSDKYILQHIYIMYHGGKRQGGGFDTPVRICTIQNSPLSTRRKECTCSGPQPLVASPPRGAGSLGRPGCQGHGEGYRLRGTP